jgi:hypothetical protein
MPIKSLWATRLEDAAGLLQPVRDPLLRQSRRFFLVKLHRHNATGALPSAQSAAAVSINKTPPPGPAPDGMVWVPGGTF